MENVLPKCECGQDVHAELVYHPVHDDGGSVDCIEVDVMYFAKCQDCYVIASEEALDREPWIEDELPF